MTEKQAETLAAIVGGEAWQSGGGVWVVTVNREDGGLVVFSGDAVCEYESDDAFDECRAARTIPLEPPEDRWVVRDDEGNTFYQHDSLELGWSDEYEAERQARALQNREGGKYWVRVQ